MNDKIIVFDCKKDVEIAWEKFTKKYRKDILATKFTKKVVIVPEGLIHFRYKSQGIAGLTGDVVNFEDFLIEYKHIKKQEKLKLIFYCGSCKFKKNGRCVNIMSECNGDIVADECSCDNYMPQKGL